MISFPYEARLHFVPSTPPELQKWLHRHYQGRYKNVEGLFVYKHLRTGNWMVAEWIGGPFRDIEDLVVVGKSPSEFTRATRAKLEFLLLGPAMDPVWEMRSGERDALRAQQDFEDEDRDVNEFVKERTGATVRVE